MNFGEAIKFGGNSTGRIHLFIFGVVEPSCLFDVPEVLLLDLFLSLLVGSLLMILYVLVSCSRACALLV